MSIKISSICCCLLFALAAEGQNTYKNFKFYLIPRTANECASNRIMYIDPGDFIVRNSKTNSKVLEFPGCFNVDAKMLLSEDLPQNLITYVQWQWKQAPPGTNFNNLGCKNRKANGCGGVGNKCFYCDSCNDLSRYNQENRNRKYPEFECPQLPGVYSYKTRRPICVDEWGELDKNNDGEPDFVNDPQYADYRRFLDSLGLDGFGTVKMNFLLLSNATLSQQRLMDLQIQNMQRRYQSASIDSIRQELRNLRVGQVIPGQERQKIIQITKNRIHRQFLQEAKQSQSNRLACLEVEFDVCDKPPSPQRAGSGGSVCN